MGYNIYEELPESRPEAKHHGTEKQIAEEIFHSTASYGDILPAGPPFTAAMQALASEYTVLKALKDTKIHEAAFLFFDQEHHGQLTLDEFMHGVHELLHPDLQKGGANQFIMRLQQGAVPSFHSSFSHVKKVGIVGAGVAGLQVCNLLEMKGIKCTVYEKSVDVAGVWRENYADFGLQVPKELYEFPGFPWPRNKTWEKFPHGPKVYEYIKDYTEHFQLREKIKFNTTVKEVATLGATGQRGWEITAENNQTKETTKEKFDYVVICTGMYGWPPHMPVARGSQNFKGEIRHSCTFTDNEQAKGKRCVVVGGGKSAIDNAVSCAKKGVSSTLLCRDWHWPVPRHLAFLVPFKWGTYSRFGHFMLYPHHEEPACARWWHGLCEPVKWVWWRIVETMFACQFCIPKSQRPTAPIELDVFNGGQILNYEFRDFQRKKKLTALKASIDKFEEDGVVLTDGKKIECDMVVYGTGFKKNYDILPKPIQEKLGIEKDGMYLYRNMIPPGVADIAFIGCEVSTFNNILTHGLQSLWLVRMITGAATMPLPGKMMRTIDKEQAWKRSWMPPSSARSSIWQLHKIRYHDILMRDLGERPNRKGCNKLGECFAPYSAADYRSLFPTQPGSWK